MIDVTVATPMTGNSRLKKGNKEDGPMRSSRY
jgi:hypothetical protein